MTAHLRRAEPQDAEACWQIRNAAIRDQCRTCYSPSAIEAWTPHAMPDHYRQVINEHPFYVMVSPQGQLLATGFLDCQTQRIEAIFTRPRAMRQGFAAQIIAKLKQEARQQGWDSVALSATPNAEPFYLKQGFIRLREDRHFSPAAKCYLDCVEMYCPLPSIER